MGTDLKINLFASIQSVSAAVVKTANENFPLHCPLYSILYQDLFCPALSDIDGSNVTVVNPKELCPLLLLGDQNLGTVANRIILEATISIIKASARLN